MLFIKKFITVALLCSLIFTAEADTAKYPPDSRSQLPPSLNNTYVGLGAGYTDIPYSNADLLNGFQAASFSNPHFGLNVYIGHYFNRYLAAEISLMRPVKWAYAYGIQTPNDWHSIWVSLFGISLRPTLPLSNKLSLYGLAGLGIVSRHGFTVNGGTTVIPSEDIYTFLTGGGFDYNISGGWHATLGVEDSLAQPQKQQPNMWYGFTSFYYLFHSIHLPKYYDTYYIFHKNLIQFGGFITSVFNPNINKYFSVGYLPVFWTGDVKARNGEQIIYQRNIFHTHKIFSFDVGVSASNYHSSVNNTPFQAYSVFPEFRFWFLRRPTADLYFIYSVAGPSYISRYNIDNIYLGGNFTFQDLMGIGGFFGHKKHLNVAMTIGHYSNGNLLPNNPGVTVPLIVSVGDAF
ncbi:MAG: hypothetical protein A3E82_00985 [Gammaproteobacteria bacterium RIFCSPHIGHO2_12_FULL_38_11]|nr:MAG: hypothetical protein A3E82_00985 [Gammaproteobacteria bacterium RIFCSPHIGHO2_12_FULL_38_11]